MRLHVDSFIRVGLQETARTQETNWRLRHKVCRYFEHPQHTRSVEYGPHDVTLSLNPEALRNALESNPDRSLLEFTDEVITAWRNRDTGTRVPDDVGGTFLTHSCNKPNWSLKSHTEEGGVGRHLEVQGVNKDSSLVLATCPRHIPGTVRRRAGSNGVIFGVLAGSRLGLGAVTGPVTMLVAVVTKTTPRAGASRRRFGLHAVTGPMSRLVA